MLQCIPCWVSQRRLTCRRVPLYFPQLQTIKSSLVLLIFFTFNLFPWLYLLFISKMPKGQGNTGIGPAKKGWCKDDDDDNHANWGQGQGGGSGHGHGHDDRGHCRRTKDINPPVPRKTSAAHKFGWLNLWTPERMQATLDLYYQCLDLYKSPQAVSASWCAALFKIPECTFLTECQIAHLQGKSKAENTSLVEPVDPKSFNLVSLFFKWGFPCMYCVFCFKNNVNQGKFYI